MNGVAVPPLRWWGWGDRDVEAPAGLLQVLHDELRISGDVVSPPPGDIATVRVPDPVLPQRLRRALTTAAGRSNVHVDHDTRVRHSAGRSYLDLLALRSGELAEAPDAVLTPNGAQEVQRILRACSEFGCAVVPFGGGTSVVGGVAPLRGAFPSVVALSLERFDGLVDIDERVQLARLEAGLTGPMTESLLAARGLTLGHFPQSFEYATVGGFAATRSAGQASSGFGRFDEMVHGIRLIAPAGELLIEAAPPAATGPSLLQTAVGSEGTLGVITDVTVRVRPRARMRHYAGWSLPSLPAGADALRAMAQSGTLPDVARLSDSDETRASFAMAAGNNARAALRYLRLRGQRDPCLLVLGWEGDGAAIGARMRRAVHVLRRNGAIALGTAPGRAWLRSRFDAPYLRDALLDRGVLVETLETAATWTQLLDVRDAVRTALHTSLTAHGAQPLIGCHISHVYAQGASLYFTVLARQEDGNQRAQWLDAKRAATDALLTAGGVLSHHHAVGRDHAPWLLVVAGVAGTGALRALRASLDPAGILNPGKLIPATAAIE